MNISRRKFIGGSAVVAGATALGVPLIKKSTAANIDVIDKAANLADTRIPYYNGITCVISEMEIPPDLKPDDILEMVKIPKGATVLQEYVVYEGNRIIMTVFYLRAGV